MNIDTDGIVRGDIKCEVIKQEQTPVALYTFYTWTVTGYRANGSEYDLTFEVVGSLQAGEERYRVWSPVNGSQLIDYGTMEEAAYVVNAYLLGAEGR